MRLVDADALKESMGESPLNWNNSPEEIQETFDWNNFTQLIDEAPTIDAELVRHGHWIWDDNGMDWYIGSWKCSICRCKNDNLGNKKNIVPSRFAGSKYCPHCGARMDEVTT